MKNEEFQEYCKSNKNTKSIANNTLQHLSKLKKNIPKAVNTNLESINNSNF